MFYNLNIISTPSTNPFLPLDLVRAHMRQDASVGDIDDGVIKVYLGAAVRRAESYLKTTLATRQYKLVLDYLPTSQPTNPSNILDLKIGNFGGFTLPKPPLISVDEIAYTNYNSIRTVLPSNSYKVVAGTPGRVGPYYGKYFSWAVNGGIGGTQIGGVEITYTAGYGVPDPTTGMLNKIPENITAGILLLAGHLYMNREASVDGSKGVLPFGVKDLFDSASNGFYC